MSEGVPSIVHQPGNGVALNRLREQGRLLRTITEVSAEKAKYEPTIFDLHGLDLEGMEPNSPEEEKQFLEWVKNILKIKPGLIDPGLTQANNHGEKSEEAIKESREFYIQLNNAFQIAKDRLLQTLGYHNYQSTRVGKGGVDNLDSKERIFDLLRKTKVSKTKEGLSQSIVYCRLVKMTVAIFRLLKEGINEIQKTKNQVEKIIMSDSPFPTEGEMLAPLILIKDSGEDGKTFHLLSDQNIKGRMEARVKTIEKAMLRGMVRPEATARVAMEDSTGFRLELDNKEHAFTALLDIYKHLLRIGKIPHLTLEDKGILSPGQIEHAKSQGIEIVSSPNEKFKALVVKGGLESDAPNKQFEIQIVLKDNKNEEGDMHHGIYDIKKKIITCTRLSGGCSESQLQKFIDEAVKESPSLTEEEISRALFKGPKASVVKIRVQEKYIIIAREVYERWDDFKGEWVDQNFTNRVVRHARHKTKKE